MATLDSQTMESHSPQSPPLSPSRQNGEHHQNHTDSPILPPDHQGQPAAANSAQRASNVVAVAAEPQTQQLPSRPGPVRTPEPRPSQDRLNSYKDSTERSPSTPGHLAPFDWEEFEFRYEQALSDANRTEQELLEEFDQLVKYFNVWASAASVHDNERGVKRYEPPLHVHHVPLARTHNAPHLTLACIRLDCRHARGLSRLPSRV
ncbi:hypothetical protein VTK73DRAFT_707 [Phialemonium thermophilum]|uniref:Uncharacterized protein n=1 Tax=Phialemonium thermophilum TaxID=223376 RepID=A0ABR3VUK7_9PEZI